MAQVPSNLIPISVTQLPVSLTTSADVLLVGAYQGVTYKFRAGDLLQVAGVPTTRQVIAGTGLAGGGQLSSNVTLSVAPGGIGTAQLANTGVAPGVYGDGTSVPQLTVDATGRVTAATTVPLSVSGYVPDTRQVIAGDGLLGGGALNTNVTLSASYGATAPLALSNSGSVGVALTLSRSDHRHPAVDLAVDAQVDGILGLNNGGTARSLVMQPGAVIYSGADGMYVSAAGASGQVLISGGTAAPTWGSALVVSPQAANAVFVGPAAGSAADPTFRALVNADLPNSGVIANSYGSGTAVPVLTVNAKGVITAASTTTVTPAWASITGTPTTIAGYGITDGVTLTGAQALSNKTIDGSLNTLSNIANNSLSNSSVTVNGSTVSLGGSTTITAVNPQALTIGTGLSGTSYNGSTAVTIANTGVLSWAGGTTGLLPATATTGAVTLSGTLVVANGGTGATDATTARTNLGAAASGANSDITGLSGITGGVSTPDYIDFHTNAGATTAVGRVFWDGGTTLNVGMTANVTGKVNETLFIYVKASATITKGQVVVEDGTVGASGVLKAKPAPLNSADAVAILGIAAESIILNDFGLIQIRGYLTGLNTTGSAVGETWADGDLLYYNPAYVGGLTKVKPSAPSIKLPMAQVVNAGSGSSGSLLVIPGQSSVLGGTDSNVQFGTLNNLDVIQYDSTAQYWKNVAASTLSVSYAATAGSAGSATTATTATNLAGGTANQLPYQTGAGTTSFVAAPTVANTYLEWSGSAFQWSANPLGTVTSVGLALPVEFTISNSPVTTSGTLTGAWAAQTANYVFAGPTTGSPATPAFRALVAGDIPALSYVSSVGATSPVASSGGLTPTISLSSGYGDTQNPYASKTANYVLAAPNGSAGVPTFRALVAGDIPTLNQNTTGSAASLSISGQTGLLTFTGLTSTNRTKTVRDAADTILELGGSYTPTGTWNWTSATVTWPTFNQNTTGQAGSVANALTLGSYLTGTSYNGSAAVTAAVDATSTNTANKVVARDSSGNFAAGTVTAALSGNATSATNLAGGAASQLPYQTGAGATSFIANGTAGQVLTSAGASAPVWAGISGGTF